MSRLIDADDLSAQFPKPDDWTDPEQVFVHITGIWAAIDASDGKIQITGRGLRAT